MSNVTDLDVVRTPEHFVTTDTLALSNRSMPSDVVHMSLEVSQVGVMMVVTKV
jgi:hypothetical protein